MATASSEKISDSEIRQRLRGSLADTGEFYFSDDPDQARFRTFRSAMEQLDGRAKLDSVALCEFPGHYSFYGGRTLLRGVRRTDVNLKGFLTGPLAEDNVDFLYAKRRLETQAVAEEFVRLVNEETKFRLRGVKKVGILLSGGMDSRVVAAVLKDLQRSGWKFDVTCFTWGQEGTRDPAYAKRIAEGYNWGYEHFQIDAETLWENVTVAAEHGSFSSAMHLHAMPAVARKAKELGVEIVVAGSYGDSIGRAEYSGSHVTQLDPIERRVRNWYGLMDERVFKQSREQSLMEIGRCRNAFVSVAGFSCAEMDLQTHYMRNMLGSAMTVVDQEVPLAQAFTSWSIVRFMWSLAPECRTDEVYLHVLRALDPELLEIPWARTGRPYLRDDLMPDDLMRSFHEYGFWTRTHLERVQETISAGRLETLGPINPVGLDFVRRTFIRFPFIHSGRLLEIMLWLASLASMVKKLELESEVLSAPKRLKAVNRFEMYGTVFRQLQSSRR